MAAAYTFVTGLLELVGKAPAVLPGALVAGGGSAGPVDAADGADERGEAAGVGGAGAGVDDGEDDDADTAGSPAFSTPVEQAATRTAMSRPPTADARGTPMAAMVPQKGGGRSPSAVPDESIGEPRSRR